MSTPTLPRWEIDPGHSRVGFSVRHLMIANVRGEFRVYGGEIALDPATPSTGHVAIAIDATSIDTRHEKRDSDLRGPLFFDVAHFPQLKFVSTSVRRGDEGWEVVGGLTIRDQTHEVVLKLEGPTAPVRNRFGETRIGVAASTKIKRSQWGLTWNAAVETGGVLVGEEIKIDIELELSPAK
jgi:polyisoprenoid-binding protein YceI